MIAFPDELQWPTVTERIDVLYVVAFSEWLRVQVFGADENKPTLDEVCERIGLDPPRRHEADE